mmetsp:Transcript_10189/g.22931  ORF Transcript_10189/g.22931 Transcript_10189/m.22931 type:complete len:219 (-) Transcript_10189:183-839(-)
MQGRGERIHDRLRDVLGFEVGEPRRCVLGHRLRKLCIRATYLSADVHAHLACSFLVRVLSDEIGAHIARQHLGHAHAGPDELAAHAPGELVHERLAGIVHCERRKGLPRRIRGDVHNVPGLLLQKEWQHRAAAIHGALAIDVHRALPFVQVQVLHQREVHHASAIDEHIDPPEFRHNTLHPGLHSRTRCGVHGHCERILELVFARIFLQFGDDGLQPV